MRQKNITIGTRFSFHKRSYDK